MTIDEIMTRQMVVDASMITLAAWEAMSDIQRGYCVVNHVGEWQPNVMGHAEWAAFMLSRSTYDFLEVD